MNSSEKNTMLIAFGLIVVMLLTFYFIPYKKLDTKKDQLTNEINTLSANYNILSQDISKKDTYLKGIEDYKKRIKELDKNLPADLTQELLIYTLTDIEKTIGIKIPSASFGMTEQLFQLKETPKGANNAQTPQESTQPNNNQQAASTAPAQNTPTTNETANNPTNTNPDTQSIDKDQETAIRRDVSANTILTYPQLKSLMTYLYGEGMVSGPEGLKSNKKRITLNNLSLSSNTETGELTTTFKLSFYGLVAAGREDEKLDLGTFDMTKKGIFLPFSGYGAGFTILDDTENTGKETSDFFIMLNPTSADQTSITMGKASGMNSSGFVYTDANKFVDATLEVYKENGTYFYKYSAGNDQYPEGGGGATFLPGNRLDLLVMSNKRNGNDDKSGANVTLINNTDLTLNIINMGDDKSMPRFKVVKTVGKVSGY